jgi:NADH-quinone oxidoreductase subunit H
MRACLALLLLALTTVSCLSQPVPALVAVADVSPRELDLGDRLDVLGGGFPEGRRATLSLRGDLHRPGQRVTEDVEVVVAAESVAEDRIVATVTEELQVELCGRGADTDHTTFRGDLVVAFAPRASGAPPVTGTLAGVVLDLKPPPPPPQIAAERKAEADRLLAFLGLAVRVVPGGLEVVSIRGGGRAASAGLLAGDLILAADGVTTRAATDLVPSGRSRSATFVARRGRSDVPLRLAIDVAGFRRVVPDGLLAGALIAALSLVLMFALIGPLARVTTRFERRLAARLRRAESLERADRASAPTGALFRLSVYLAFVAHGFLLTYLAFGGYLASRELDVPLAFFVVATLLVAMELCAGGYADGLRWSLRRGAFAAFRRLGVEVCAALALASAALSAGGMGLADATRQQGGLPWRWAAAESPMLAAALVVLVATAAGRPPLLGRAAPKRLERAIFALSKLAHGLNALFVASLGAVLFLGGWRIPGVSPTDPALSWHALGAFVFLGKAWLVLAVIAGVRWAAPRRVLVKAQASDGLRWMLPCAVLAFAAVALTELRSVPPLPGVLRDGLGVLTTVAVLALGAGFVARIALALRGKVFQLNVNPWL